MSGFARSMMRRQCAQVARYRRNRGGISRTVYGVKLKRQGGRLSFRSEFRQAWDQLGKTAARRRSKCRRDGEQI